MNLERDEAKRLRIHDESLADDLVRSARNSAQGMPSLVARTTKISSYPILAHSFYACTPLTVLGQEVEGGSGTINPGNSTFFALNVGSAIPAIGVNVVATFVDNRWVFRYDD